MLNDANVTGTWTSRYSVSDLKDILESCTKLEQLGVRFPILLWVHVILMRWSSSTGFGLPALPDCMTQEGGLYCKTMLVRNRALWQRCLGSLEQERLTQNPRT